MSSSGTFVAKRFLAGVEGDYVNSDHIVRIYWSAGKLFAMMDTGPAIQLKTTVAAWSPGTSPAASTFEMMSL